MRILVVSGTFPPMKSGGAEYAFWLCQRLAQAKQEVHVLTRNIEGISAHAGVQVYPIIRQWNWSALPILLRLVRQCRPDVVDLHFAGGVYDDHPMITFLPTLLKRYHRDLAVVTHIEYPIGVHLQRSSLAARILRKCMARWVNVEGVDWGFGTILRDSDRLIILSEPHRHVLARLLSSVESKCTLIPPPPNLQVCPDDNGTARLRGRRLAQVQEEHFLLVYYGYLYPGKGLETLLEAMRVIASEVQHVRLLLVGGSNEVVLRSMNRPQYVKELEDLAQRIGIMDIVRFTGFCASDSEEASLYLRGADACVLPFDDGVMLHRSSVAAAAVHGVPIITTKGAFSEPAFVDRHNVLLCRPNDPKELATALRLLASDPKLQQQLRTGALQLAREWFSWERVVKHTVEVFQESINGRVRHEHSKDQ